MLVLSSVQVFLIFLTLCYDTVIVLPFLDFLFA